MINVHVHDVAVAVDVDWRRPRRRAPACHRAEDMYLGESGGEALDVEGRRWHFAECCSDIRNRNA